MVLSIDCGVTQWSIRCNRVHSCRNHAGVCQWSMWLLGCNHRTIIHSKTYWCINHRHDLASCLTSSIGGFLPTPWTPPDSGSSTNRVAISVVLLHNDFIPIGLQRREVHAASSSSLQSARRTVRISASVVGHVQVPDTCVSLSGCALGPRVTTGTFTALLGTGARLRSLYVLSAAKPQH